jgi:hypothetical protein
MRYLLIIAALFCSLPQISAQNNIAYGAGISYTNGAPSFTPPARTSRVAIDTVTGKWYHYNTPGGWQLLGNTIEEIAGCTTPAYTPTKGDSKVVINNCTAPELYYWTGSAWVWINEGATYYAGEGIRIQNDSIILDSLYYLQFRTGSALDGSVGRVQWNDTDGTLDLQLKGGNVTLQIGQEEVSLVKHADNSGLIEGRVVYIVGADGTNKTVRYALATADATSATTFGLMTESATGGNKAFCTTFGLVRNLNTTNLTEGGIVWLSADTAGALTAVRPTAPKHGVMIGFCVRKHATQGAIFVQVQNGYELNELHDVFVPNPINNQVLTWDNIDKRWEAKTVADSSATNELQTLSVATNTATLSNSGGSVTIAGAGINTVGTAGTTITVTGTEVDGSVSNELQTLSTGTNTLTLSNGGGTVTVDTDPSDDVTGSGTAGQVTFWNGTNSITGDNSFTWNNTNGLIVGGIQYNGYGTSLSTTGVGFSTAGSNRTLTMQSGNNNNASDVTGISINSGTLINRTASTSFRGTTLTGQLQSGTTNLTSFTALYSSYNPKYALTTFIGYDYDPLFTANPTNHYAALFRSGLVGIGLSAPTARLQVRSTGTTSTTNAFLVENSTPATVFSVRENGDIYGFSGIMALGSDGRLYTNRVETKTSTTGLIELTGGYTGNSAINFNTFTTVTKTSGSFSLTQYATGGFQPTSGNATFTFQTINGVINQTGGANGITRGLHVAPTLTSAFDWRSIEWSNNSGWGLYGAGTAKSYFAGNVAIGTTTQNASSAFEVASTTQGILFPRMTKTQRDAIATPADGLVIYNTTDNKLQVRAAGAWIDLH